MVLNMTTGIIITLLALVVLHHHAPATSAQLTSLAMRPHGVSEEYVLLRYLLTNYSKVARPVARYMFEKSFTILFPL